MDGRALAPYHVPPRRSHTRCSSWHHCCAPAPPPPVQHGDFYEGVRALLVDKDGKPAWRPAALADVTPALVEEHFAELGERELVLPEG